MALTSQNAIYVKIFCVRQEMWCSSVVKCALWSAECVRRTEPSIVNQDGGIKLSAMLGTSPVVEDGGGERVW